MDRWLDELGIYDFFGVICPSIFLIGFIWLFITINFQNNDTAYIKNILEIFYCKSGQSIDVINIVDLKYFVYLYLIVLFYVVGMFMHEIGHIVMEVYVLGVFKFFSQDISSCIKTLIQYLTYGNNESEETFLMYNYSNDNSIERNIWFKLMLEQHFDHSVDSKEISNDLEYNIVTFKEKIGFIICRRLDIFKWACTKEKYDKFEKLLKLSAAFFQHCKRVVNLQGKSKTSRKKKAIYGFSRNLYSIFFLASIFLILFANIGYIKISETVFYRELFCYILVAGVFLIKAVRYKHMEVIDVIRTYKYLVYERNDELTKRKIQHDA